MIQKFRREAAARHLPGKGSDRRPFWFVSTDHIQDWQHRFERQTGSLDITPQAINTDVNRQSYLMSALLEEAFTSSVLEGAVATREQAQEMVRSGRPPRDRSEQMILNNYSTMRCLREWKDEPFSPDLLLRIHRSITENALDKPDAVGRLRRPDETIAVEDDIDGTIYFKPPPAESLPERMVIFTAFANEKTPDYYLHPVLRAIILHFWLAYEHPFVDGNGRTARALFYWSMLRAKYPQFEYISISHFINKARVEYAKTYLQVETDENDLTYFINFHLRIIDQAMRKLLEHIQKKQVELEETESRLRRLSEFNHRQQALLIHALKNPKFRYTIQGHQKSHGVVYQTARTDLLSLVRAKLFVQHRQRARPRQFARAAFAGKAFVFTPAPDLAEKLSGKQKP